MKLGFNGTEFTGDNFEIKKNVLYVDGHAVMDLKPETEELSITGDGTLTCETTTIIYGDFKGTINAQKVIINGEQIGDIFSERVIINGEHKGTINVGSVQDNR